MIKFAVCFIVFLVIGMITADAQTMPKEGDNAPDFPLKDQNGAAHSLADYKGRYVVLYFYPQDDTPGCTREACSFRDDISTLTDKGTAVLGVSTDDVDSHKLFAEKYHLNFPLLADTEKTVSEKYGVLGTSGKPKRVTFLIDGNGVIAKVYPQVNPTEHSAEIISDIDALKN